ncbi:MAG: redoxin domain-containing protein [Candidatus Hydrogenedentota bacterium]
MLTRYAKSARRWSLVAGTLALAFTLSGAAAAQELGEVEIGEQMPDFTMNIVGMEDEEVTLSELEDKLVVLSFRCNTCPWVRGADPDFNEVVENFEEDEEVVFYGVNPHDQISDERILEYAEEAELNQPILRDEGHEYADKVGATRTPEIYIVDNRDPDDMMVLKYHGAFDDRDVPNEAGDTNYVAEAVQQLLADEEVEIAEANAWGCTINR